MANPLQTSLQEEFNRLNFLASIATGSTNADVGQDSPRKSDQIIQVTTTVNSPSHNSINPNYVNGSHTSITKSVPNSPVNGLNSKSISASGAVGSIGKINSLLINSGLQPSTLNTASYQIRNINTASRFTRPSVGRQQNYSPRGPRSISQIRPQMQSPRNPTARFATGNRVNLTMVKSSQSQPIVSNKPLLQSTVNTAPKLTYVQNLTDQQKRTAHTLTEQQKRILLSGVNILQNSNHSASSTSSSTPTLNSPLIISQAQQQQQQQHGVSTIQTKIVAQPTISTTTGQTILLPANFAGMSGKVYIVNNPGKPPQAIALTSSNSSNLTSLQQLQQQVIAQTQQDNNVPGKKPVLLLPSTQAPQKHNIQKATALQPTSSSQPLVNLQPNQQQVVNNALQIIAAQNNSTQQQQLKIQQTSSSGHQQLSRLQQAQPISMSSFQNIRPKSFLASPRSIQPRNSPKTTTPIKSTMTIDPNQNIRLSHFSNQTSAFEKQSITINPNILQVNQQGSITITPSQTNASLMTQFDKQMSQHLQTLEKTDPHLFVHKGNKLIINQSQNTTAENKNFVMKPAVSNQQLQDKMKTVLQQQQQQQHQGKGLTQTNNLLQQQLITSLQNNTQSSSVLTQLPSNSQSSTKTQYNSVTQQIAVAAQQGPQSTASLNQILSLPQKQQANLQTILKQQLLQQQQQQILQNKSGKLQQLQQQAATQQLRQQLQQQQQQKLNQVTSEPQLFMLQQKILQQVQNQQKIAPQLLNVPQSSTSQQHQQHMQSKLEIGQQAGSQSNQPLKLLSSLTNMVSSSLSAKTVNTTTFTQSSIVNTLNNQVNTNHTAASGQQNMQPVLVQLQGGTHMLHTTQLTPQQILDLQKHIVANQTVANRSIAPQTQVRPRMPTIINTVRNQNPIGMSSAAKIAIQSLQNRSIPAHNKSAFAPHGTKAQIAAHQQIVQRTSLAPSLKESMVMNKSVQDHLKNLSPAQRELIVKQFAAGKLGGSQSMTNPAVLASILKSKNIQGVKSGLSFSSLKNITMSQKKVETKIVQRGVKRTLEQVKKEPEEHPFDKRWRALLSSDQSRYISTSYKLPFSSRRDAIKRLVPYHICQEEENQLKDYNKNEQLLKAYSQNVQQRKEWMIGKLNLLLLDESQVERPSCDDIHMGRLFVNGEVERFQQQKKAILEGRAFVVKNERNNELECIEIKEEEKQEEEEVIELTKTDNTISINLSQRRHLDDRLVIAHKDIANIDSALESDDEQEEEIEDDDEDEYREEETAQEIEVEEISVDTMELTREDSELAAATSNLLADLNDDDYHFDFDL